MPAHFLLLGVEVVVGLVVEVVVVETVVVVVFTVLDVVEEVLGGSTPPQADAGALTTVAETEPKN